MYIVSTHAIYYIVSTIHYLYQDCHVSLFPDTSLAFYYTFAEGFNLNPTVPCSVHLSSCFFLFSLYKSYDKVFRFSDNLGLSRLFLCRTWHYIAVINFKPYIY